MNEIFVYRLLYLCPIFRRSNLGYDKIDRMNLKRQFAHLTQQSNGLQINEDMKFAGRICAEYFDFARNLPVENKKSDLNR